MKTSAMMRCPKCEKTSELDNLHLLDRSFKLKWEGLTEDEIALINADYPNPWNVAKAIEAKLKEKNSA